MRLDVVNVVPNDTEPPTTFGRAAPPRAAFGEALQPHRVAADDARDLPLAQNAQLALLLLGDQCGFIRHGRVRSSSAVGGLRATGRGGGGGASGHAVGGGGGGGGESGLRAALAVAVCRPVEGASAGPSRGASAAA